MVDVLLDVHSRTAREFADGPVDELAVTVAFLEKSHWFALNSRPSDGILLPHINSISSLRWGHLDSFIARDQEDVVPAEGEHPGAVYYAMGQLLESLMAFWDLLDAILIGGVGDGLGRMATDPFRPDYTVLSPEK